uniref:CSON003637 protein n=1 Tax=Culicoides sonorensis TaxID=179676 RepID=A0A336MT51_CULSO
MHFFMSMLSVIIGAASAQLLISQPLPYALQAHRSNSLAHPVVVANSLAESQLPPQLLNDQYKNPHIAAALAKESLPINKEMIVFDRETDKIPRDRIFKIFKNAGWVHRR